MPRQDLTYTFIISIIISVFLIPSFVNTGLFDKYPAQVVLPIQFIGVPLLFLVGILAANFIGNKIQILWQFAKFVAVGFSNTAIDFGGLNFLSYLTGITHGVGIVPLNVTSFSIAIINSFFWNKKWVFAGKKNADFVIFVMVTLVGAGINSGIVYGVTTHIPIPPFVPSEEIWVNIAKALATGVSLVWNFTGYKLIVFKK